MKASEVENKIVKSTINGPYAGRDMCIIMLEDKERDFVVTHDANIKPVSYFIGRETELQELRQRIEEKRKSVLVSGMGGIGKTHICRKLFDEYLRKHANDEYVPFKYIGFVEYSGDMNNDLQKCLKFKQQGDAKLNQEAAWMELSQLASDGKLLLFVDNVNRSMREDPGLERLKGIPGSIILTSRRTSFSKEFEPYRIGFLNSEQCREIYEKIRFEGSEKKIKDEEAPDLEYVIEKLAARHTITIEFLARLAQTKLWSVERLKKELERNGFQLEYKIDEDELVNIQDAYESLYKLSELTGAEQNILEAFSVFPYISLPAETCNQWLLSDAGARKDEDILMVLYQKGWLQFDIEQESFTMHPVFARFIYTRCKPCIGKHLGMVNACKVKLFIPQSGNLLPCLMYIPFAEEIIEKMDMGQDLQQAEFIIALANLFRHLADYEKAEKLFDQVLNDCDDLLGENNPSIIKIYNNLACIYIGKGELKRAEILCKKNAKLCAKIILENHIDALTCYHNLGFVYYRQGEYKNAERILEKCVKIFEEGFVIDQKNNAPIYFDNVKGDREEDAIQEFFEIIASGYTNLANVYAKQERYEDAEDLYMKGLEIRKEVLGEEHPDTGESYNNLATVYVDIGEYEKAKKMFYKCKKICETNLGENHPDTATCYSNLGLLYFYQGIYGEAELFLKKCLEIYKKVLGEKHSVTRESYIILADVYVNQEKYQESKELYEKYICMCDDQVEDCLEAAKIYNNLARIYIRLDENQKALDLLVRLFRIMFINLGIDNINTRICMANAGNVYLKLNPENDEKDFMIWLVEKIKEDV